MTLFIITKSEDNVQGINMSFKRFLGYKAIKWSGISLMAFGLFIVIQSLSIPYSYSGPSYTGPAIFLLGVVFLIIGWLIMQYGAYKEATTVITAGVKDVPDRAKEKATTEKEQVPTHSKAEYKGEQLKSSSIRKEETGQEVLFSESVEVYGKEYVSHTLDIRQVGKVVFEIEVQGLNTIDFHILDKESLPR